MSIDIIYAGHSAIIIKGQKATVAIDPWLEGNPSCPENLKNPDKLDAIVLTHGHSDHAGDTVRLAKHYGCKVFASYELAVILSKEGVPEGNIVFMNKGGTVAVDNIEVTLTQAFHSNSYDTISGTVYAGEACGAIVKIDGKVIYHAGDTCLFSDMTLIRDLYKPEIGFLPIGDRFTMGPKEAAIAATLLGIKIAVPIHYATFPLLSGTAEEFVLECQKKSVKTKVITVGESFSLT